METGEEPAPRTRFRPRRAEPWNIGSVIPWGAVATLADPALLLAPMVFATVFALAGLALGAPVRPETLVPAWSLPPFGAYQDAGVVALGVGTTVLVWAARAGFLVARAFAFGLVAHFGLQRSAGNNPSLTQASEAVRAKFGALLVLELVSWSLFGIPLVLGQGSLVSAGRPVSQLGAMVGTTALVNAYFAVLQGAGPWRAIGRGVAWLGHRPLGHLALCIAATAASNGVFWIARAGEVGAPRALPLAAYALVHSVVVAMFTCAFARRYHLLYSDDR